SFATRKFSYVAHHISKSSDIESKERRTPIGALIFIIVRVFTTVFGLVFFLMVGGGGGGGGIGIGLGGD
ncbi:unnamed protein product, partial [Orchesella dallaii]